MRRTAPTSDKLFHVEHLVTFLPAAITVSVDGKTTLLQAAQKAKLPVGQSCRAEGICGRCGLRVVSGAENLSGEQPQEARVKSANRVEAGMRLSCQARVQGPVTATADYW
jgi:2Fe-2S ferredoxin